MNKEIEILIKKSTIRSIQIALMDAKIEGRIIPDYIFEIIKEVEETFDNISIDEITAAPRQTISFTSILERGV